MSARSEKYLLNYHNSLIHESDIELLSGPHWLNDTIIGFYLEYLEMEVYADTDIIFIRPEVTQCLKLSPVSEYGVFLDPLKFRQKAFALMPLNDCDNPNMAGGSHWSLLVYSQPENSFFHVDSSQGSNISQARLLSSKLSQYMHQRLSTEFRTLNSLQQSNSYDCGVFVLCNIDTLVKHILRHHRVTGVDLTKETQVSRKRNEVRQIIESLARKRHS